MTDSLSGPRFVYAPHVVIDSTGISPTQMTAGGSIEPSVRKAFENMDITFQSFVYTSGNGRKTAEQRIREEIDEAAGQDSYFSARAELVQLVCVHGKRYPTLSEYALDKLILLLESDPLSKESAEGSLRVVTELMGQLKSNIIQHMTPDFKKKMARAFYLAIENYLTHLKKKQVGSITLELKNELLTTQNDLDKLNNGDTQLKKTIAMSKEAIKRITDNCTKLDTALNILSTCAEGVGALWQKDIASFCQSIAKAVDESISKIKSSWYDKYVMARAIAQNALIRKHECIKLLLLMSKSSAFKDENLSIGYAELLAYIARHTKNPKIRKLAIFSSEKIASKDKGEDVKGLHSFVVKGKDSNTRCRAAELLISFLNSDDKKIVHAIRVTLYAIYDQMFKKDTSKKEEAPFKKDEALRDLLSAAIPKETDQRKKWLEEFVDLKPKPTTSSGANPVSVVQQPDEPVSVNWHDDDPEVVWHDEDDDLLNEDPQLPPGNVSVPSQLQLENKSTQSAARSVFGNVAPPPSLATSLGGGEAPPIRPTASSMNSSQLQLENKVTQSVATTVLPASSPATTNPIEVRAALAKCFPGSNISPESLTSFSVEGIQSSGEKLVFTSEQGITNFADIIKTTKVKEVNLRQVDVSGFAEKEICLLLTSLKDCNVKVVFGKLTRPQIALLAKNFVGIVVGPDKRKTREQVSLNLTFTSLDNYDHMGKMLYNVSYYALAIGYYDEGIKLFPDTSDELLLFRAEARKFSGDYFQAELDLYACLSRQVAQPTLHRLAYALRELANISKIKSQRAEGQHKIARLEEALFFLERCLLSNCSYFDLSYYLDQLAQISDSILQLDPNNRFALFGKSYVLWQRWNRFPTDQLKQENKQLLLDAIELLKKMANIENSGHLNPNKEFCEYCYERMLKQKESMLKEEASVGVDKAPAPAKTHTNRFSPRPRSIEVYKTLMKCFPGSNISRNRLAPFFFDGIQCSGEKLVFTSLKGIMNFITIIKTFKINEVNFAYLDLSKFEEKEMNLLIGNLRGFFVKLTFGELTSEQVKLLDVIDETRACRLVDDKEKNYEVIVTGISPVLVLSTFENIYELGNWLINKKKPILAIAYCSEGIKYFEKHPDVYQLYRLRGKAYFQTCCRRPASGNPLYGRYPSIEGALKNAESDFLQTLSKNINDIRVMNELASLYLFRMHRSTSQHDKLRNQIFSRCHLEMVLAIEPNNSTALRNLASLNNTAALENKAILIPSSTLTVRLLKIFRDKLKNWMSNC